MTLVNVVPSFVPQQLAKDAGCLPVPFPGLHLDSVSTELPQNAPLPPLEQFFIFFIKNLFSLIFMCNGLLPVCVSVYHMCAWCPEGQKRASDPWNWANRQL